MRAGLEQRRQLVVGQVVIDVAQLVVDGGEIFLVGLDAHLGAHVRVGALFAAHVHVPRAGVADHVTVQRLDELGALPIAFRQLGHVQRGVEILRAFGHLLGGLQVRGAFGVEQGAGVRIGTRLGDGGGVVLLVLLFQCAGDVQAARTLVRFQDIPQVAPVLLPHVAHQVGGQQAVDLALVRAVGGLQFVAGEAVQLFVQRLHLFPQAVAFSGQFHRAHVITTAPHFTGIGEAQFAGTLVDQFGEALVIRAHRLGDGVPAFPGLQLLVVVAAAAQHVFQFAQLTAHLGIAFAGAIAARAVHAFHARSDLRQFSQLGRIAGGGHGGAQLQQVDGARGFRRHLLAFELA